MNAPRATYASVNHAILALLGIIFIATMAISLTLSAWG